MFVEQSIGSLQKKYSIGSFELLSQTAPIQALSLLLLGPFVDYFLTGKLLANYKISSVAFVSIPCLLKSKFEYFYEKKSDMGMKCSFSYYCHVPWLYSAT